jgi:hypothetical protein
MPRLPTDPRAIFDLIHSQADSAAFIRGLVDPDDPTFEFDTLEFKGLPDPDPKEQKLKDVWSEALSGFANCGGVIVWGIDACKKPLPGTDKEVDAAWAVRPLREPLHSASRLTELLRTALDPPLPNVRVEAYPRTPTPADGGFVVCLIPEGPQALSGRARRRPRPLLHAGRRQHRHHAAGAPPVALLPADQGSVPAPWTVEL